MDRRTATEGDATGRDGDAADASADEPDTGGEPVDGDVDVPTCYCPLGGVVDLLSRKHAMQLVCVVGALGPVRYGGIEEAFGDVSSSTLSARLDELVEAGYLSREQYAEIPPRVEYDLTTDGEELCDRLVPLLEWAERQDHLP